MPEATTAPGATVPPVPPTGPKSPDAARARGGKAPAFAFLVEVAGTKNENLMCPIDQFVCRGRWSRKNLIGKQFDGDFAGMPDLPGLCFLVNTDKRLVRRFDPLADEDNAKLLKRAQRIALAVTGTKMIPEKAKKWEGRMLDDNTLKTFVFWVRRMLDVELFGVVRGSVPEVDEILKLPGTIQWKAYDQMAGVERGCPNDKIRYAKPVPAEQDEADELYSETIPDPVINSAGMGFADDRSVHDQDDDGE